MLDARFYSLVRQLWRKDAYQRFFLDLCRGGLPVINRRLILILPVLYMSLRLFIIICITFPFVGFLVLISPLIRIRFAEFETRKLGHFSSPIEVYLCERSNRLDRSCEPKCCDLWFSNKIIANKVLYNKYRNYLNVVASWWARPMYESARILPFGRRLLLPYPHWRDEASSMRPDKPLCWQVYDIHRVVPQYAPFIRFSQTEESQFETLLELADLSRGKYVNFFARESALI